MSIFDNNIHVQKPGKFSLGESNNPIPYQQWANCDIKGFDLHLGYGSQETTLTLNLVETMEPPAAGQTGTGQDLINETYPNAESCDSPSPDQPCVTRAYNGVLGQLYNIQFFATNGDVVFEFAGVLQDHDIKMDSGGRTITARLVDGKQYLDNVTIITNKYYSRSYVYDNSTGSSKNVLNALYEAEPGVSAQFDKLTNYTSGLDKCAYYMDSGTDKDGMPALFVLGQFMSATRYLSFPLTTQQARINIDDVYNALTSDVKAIPLRINDTSISLLSLLQMVSDATGREFFAYMEYNDSGFEIVVKTIDKTKIISGTTLRNKINDLYYSQSRGSRNYSSVSYGQEAVTENTRNIIIGSNMRYMLEIERDTQFDVFGTSSWENWQIQTWTSTTPDPQDLDNVIPKTGSEAIVKTLDYTEKPSTACYDASQWVPQGGGTCNIPTGGGRIAMLLGEMLNGFSADGIPTYRLNVSNLCGDIIDTTYDITELCQILGLGCTGTARLSQEELLFSETYESYINWSIMHPGSIGHTFGQAIFGSLWGNFEKYALKIFADIVDNGSFDSFKDPALAFPDAQVSQKLFEVVHQYVKNIYDNYYGREYVVLLDSKINGVNSFDVCLGKSYNTWSASADGQTPSSSPSSATLPISQVTDFIQNGVVQQAIKTAGSNGYLSATDTIVNGGWFAGTAAYHSNILGIDATNGLSTFLNDDNTIGGFIKYGPVDNICKRIGNVTFSFRVDLSDLDPKDFYIYQNNLYLRASFSEEMYFTAFAGANYGGDKVFARFSIPRVKLVPSLNTNAAVGRAASRMALIALQAMTDITKLDAIADGTITLEQAIKDKLAGGGINPGTWDGIASNLAITNLAKISVPAIVPLAVAIPFESQTMTYGPWHFQTEETGGMQVIDYDINPWSYGFGSTAHNDSFVNMRADGMLLARNGACGRTYQEKATLSFVGLPSFNIGSLADDTDIQSAILSDITFNFGVDGAKTNMTYQTFSPKFGSMPQYVVEANKKTIANKLEYMRTFRADRYKNRAMSLKLREDVLKIMAGKGGGGGGGSAGTENPTYNSKYDHSPSKLLVGGYLNKNTTEEITNNSFNVGTDSSTVQTHTYTQDKCEDIDNNPFPLTKNAPDNTNGNILKRYVSAEIHPTYEFDTTQAEYYKNMSIMSMDGIFLPVSVNGGTNNKLCRYATPKTYSTLPKSRPIHSMPPIQYNGQEFFNLDIHNKYLNPILNTSIMSSDWSDGRQNGSNKGFVIINIGQGDTPQEHINFDELKETGGSTAIDRANFSDFRFHALRGPLVLQSWGYDINGKPIPNANDSATAAEAGQFNDIFLKDKFLKNWLANPKTWPVGPIDLRWDRHRGVWVSPPANKIIVARLTSKMNPFGTASAELLNPASGGKQYYNEYNLYGPDGENIKEDVRNCTVTVHDYIGQALPKCAIVYVYYDDGKYIVVNAGVNILQRARIGSGNTISCNGKCKGELFYIEEGGGYSYGDPYSIEIIDTMGIVPQTLPGYTRLWVTKLDDSPAYEIVYIGNREDANCGSCGGFGVYSIAGVDFNKLPTVTTVGKVLTVTDGGCLALVGTSDCTSQSSAGTT
jgi:hypothetical protein